MSWFLQIAPCLSHKAIIRGHLLDFFVDPLEKYLSFLFKGLLTPIQQPCDYLSVFELHLRLLVIRALNLDHINLIHLLLYLLNLLIQFLLIRSDHRCLIVAFKLSGLLEKMHY